MTGRCTTCGRGTRRSMYLARRYRPGGFRWRRVARFAWEGEAQRTDRWNRPLGRAATRVTTLRALAPRPRGRVLNYGVWERGHRMGDRLPLILLSGMAADARLFARQRPAFPGLVVPD